MEHKKPRLGMQLISYGKRQEEDLEGVLREVAEVGFKGVETGVLMDKVPAEELRRILSETGLVLCGMHAGYQLVADDEMLSKAISYLKAVGSKFLICSGVAPGEGIERYDVAAERFNEVGRRCKEEGLVFLYHNHAWEFEEVEGTKGIHRLAERTDPELVKFCIDVYWVHVGGEDPAEFIRRYKERAPYFHFKDGGKGWFTELGKGEVDLPKAKEAAVEAGAEWIIYEQDRTEKDPKESAEESLQYLRGLGL
ncbi:MAG TPA: sugar phosphate isomerase/epimerase [Armatimonadetes bacterium]|nr:sugar phosphate isomerase/epimerase [Armatimonadota bacterium]